MYGIETSMKDRIKNECIQETGCGLVVSVKWFGHEERYLREIKDDGDRAPNGDIQPGETHLKRHMTTKQLWDISRWPTLQTLKAALDKNNWRDGGAN